MISRSTLVGALVVAELAIVFAGVRAVAGPSSSMRPAFTSDWSGAEHATGLNRTLVTAPNPHVVVDAGDDVDLVITVSDVPAVRAVETTQRWGYISAALSQLTAAPTPDGVRISASGAGPDHIVIGALRRELALTVPPAARVEVTSASSLDATGLQDRLVAHVSDAVRIRDHRGDVDASTSDGRIELTDVQGREIRLHSDDGRLILTRVGADRLIGSTKDGRILGDSVRVVDGALTTQDGRAIVSFAADSDAVVTAHTNDGKVTVSGLPVATSSADFSSVRLGAGRGRFEVSSGDGSISITPGGTV